MVIPQADAARVGLDMGDKGMRESRKVSNYER